MTLNAIDFSTIRAARQLMTDDEAALALELGNEAERNNGAAAVAFWRYIRCILADSKRRQAEKAKADDAR
jgi:hypothetical protein